MIKQQLDADLKVALLARDELASTTLRGLKSALLYEEVAKGKRESGLTEDEALAVVAREAKKRQESADLYRRGGDETRAAKELQEKVMLECYLPQQLSETELVAVIDKIIAGQGAVDMTAMGPVIGEVKRQTGAAADGATIARLVKERLSA